MPTKHGKGVEGSRFPPIGKRGLDGAGTDADLGFADTRKYLKHANEEVFVVFQIEDRQAVEAVGEIAAVTGFDLLFICLGDLSLSYAVPLEFDHALLQVTTRQVAKAARKNGKKRGTTTACPEKAQCALNLGALPEEITAHWSMDCVAHFVSSVQSVFS